MSISFGSIGNGICVWKTGTNTIVAHISAVGHIEFKEEVTKEESWAIQVMSNRQRVRYNFLQRYPQFSNSNDHWVNVYMADESPTMERDNVAWFLYQDFLVAVHIRFPKGRK